MEIAKKGKPFAQSGREFGQEEWGPGRQGFDFYFRSFSVFGFINVIAERKNSTRVFAAYSNLPRLFLQKLLKFI